jgi:DMSO/TMAO reductase YedYZ heme-binding membrane subunit
MARRGTFEGWRIVGYAALIVSIVVAATVRSFTPGEDALRAGIRATATTSLALLLAAFVASSWNTLRPSPLSKWLLRNRRQLGVSFAVSHLAHLALIVLLAQRFPESFWKRLAMTTLVGGALGYVLTALMTATSFDRTAAWLGKRAWKALHTAGMFYLWGVFVFSYVARVAQPRYAILFASLAIAMCVRVSAALKKRARKSVSKQCSG